MKKLVLSMLCALVTLSAYGQGEPGTALLSNVAAVPNGGVVKFDNGDLAGSDVLVQFALPDGTLLGTPSNVLSAGVFRDTTAKSLDGIAAGATDLVVKAWDPAADALIGTSDVFSLNVGGAGSGLPAGSIPGSFSGIEIPTIPEPSTVALAILGGAALFFRRRK